MSKAKDLHAKAAQARESGNFLESLHLTDDAILAYDAENDDVGLPEGISCRAITTRVYANLQKPFRRNLLIIAKHEMMAAVEIARLSNNPQALAMPLFNLAQIQEDLGEFQGAVKTYSEAVENFEQHVPEQHNRPSVLANMNIHMKVCEYKSGDKTALERAEQALNDLIKAEEPDTYSRDVWISGAHMRIATALKDKDREAARKHMEEAKKIIDANPDLKVRRGQWEKLNISIQ